MLVPLLTLPLSKIPKKKSLGDNAFRLMRKDPPQLQGLDTLNPAFSFRKMPIRSNHLHFAVHHNQPISISFLNRWQGREKLNREAGTIEGREESYDLGYHRIRPSESLR
jgi:hypothetical protein